MKKTIFYASLLLLGGLLIQSCSKDELTNPLLTTEQTPSDNNALLTNTKLKNEQILVSENLLENLRFANIKNPYDYIGRKHNELVYELVSMDYGTLTGYDLEEAVKSNTQILIEQEYGADNTINLDVLNTIQGYQGLYSDINFDTEYEQILSVSGLSSQASGFIASYMNDAIELSQNIKSGISNPLINAERPALVLRQEFFTKLVLMENQYLTNLASSTISSDEKQIISTTFAILRYSAAMNTNDEDTPIPTLSRRKWWIIGADVAGGVIGGFVGGVLGVLQGAAAGSGIAVAVTTP